MAEITILPPLNPEAAIQKQAEIDVLLGQISSHEMRLASSYARLGGLLREVKLQQYWIALGYDRFSSYLESIRGKIDRQRSQMYAILSVAEALLPLMSEEQMEKIGITKSHELRRLVLQGGSIETVISLSAAECYPLWEYASDPNVTAAQLRVKVNELLHIHETPSGLWFELPGFYATPDERKEISAFWELGRKVLQIASEKEYEIHKEVFLAATRECRSTWLEMEHEQNQIRPR
jgi:hypothetical protein